MACAIWHFIPSLLISSARAAPTRPPAPLAYTLASDLGEHEFLFDGRGWPWPPTDGSDQPRVRIEGAASSLIPFAFGRMSRDTAGLRVTGDRDLVNSFKAYIPGP